ncbi:uncharacterized protein M6G45_008910 isoform 1-T1 [Spheniscus humboldti]
MRSEEWREALFFIAEDSPHCRVATSTAACCNCSACQKGTKLVILRHQTFDEAQVTSDSAHGANKESLSAFVEDVETSVSVDFPEDEERVGEVLGCGSLDLSVRGGTEAAQHEDEKMTAAASQKL